MPQFHKIVQSPPSAESFQPIPLTKSKRKRKVVHQLPLISAAISTPSPSNNFDADNTQKQREGKIFLSAIGSEKEHLPPNVLNIDGENIDFRSLIRGVESYCDISLDGSLQDCNQLYWSTYAGDFYKVLTTSDIFDADDFIRQQKENPKEKRLSKTIKYVDANKPIFITQSAQKYDPDYENQDEKFDDSSLSSRSSVFSGDSTTNRLTLSIDVMDEVDESSLTKNDVSPQSSVNNSDYSLHPDLTTEMRTILMDWLVEVCEECKVSSLTLFHTAELVDRVLSLTPNQVAEGGLTEISSEMLQCVGCACLLIAVKLQECGKQHSWVDDLVFLSDYTYTRSQILEMELQICISLRFTLKCLTLTHFLERYVLAGCVCRRASVSSECYKKGFPSSNDNKRIPSVETQLQKRPKPTLSTPVSDKNNDMLYLNLHNAHLLSIMTSYLLELAMVNNETRGPWHSKRLITAAAVYIAKVCCFGADNAWNESLTHFTGFQMEQLKEAIMAIHKLWACSEAKENSVYKKYSKENYLRVARRTVVSEVDVFARETIY